MELEGGERFGSLEEEEREAVGIYLLGLNREVECVFNSLDVLDRRVEVGGGEVGGGWDEGVGLCIMIVRFPLMLVSTN